MSNDPLNILIRWPTYLREDIRDALLPFVRLHRRSGEIKWLNDAPTVAADAEEVVMELADAVAAELGYERAFTEHLSPEQAETTLGRLRAALEKEPT